MENLNDRILKSMAILMSCLVITIPFYVADVFAVTGTVNIVSIKGKEGAEGSRTADNSYVDVIADVIATSANTPQNTHLKYYGVQGFETFSRCDIVEQPYGYNCSYRSSSGLMYPNIYTFYVCLAGCCSADCNSCTESRCRAQANIYVDGYPPEIKSFDIDKVNTTGKDITMTYSIEDKMCTQSACAGKCSGLKKVEVIDQNTSTILATQDLSTKDCAKQGTVNFSITQSNGPRQICIKAYDMLDQASSLSSSSCKRVNKDSSGPSIKVADIFDSSGTSPLRYVKGGGTDAKFLVKIVSSKYFGLSKATADLTGFNLGEVDLSCTGSSGNYTCEKPFNLQLSSSTTSDVLVTITDAAGTESTTTSSITIEMDTSAPVVKAILTSYNSNNTGYFGVGVNNITAVIEDTGAGLGGSHVTITPAGQEQKNAVLCSYCIIGEYWFCSIYNITINADTAVTVKGTDDSGNVMTPFTRVVKYDNVKPNILNVTIRNIANTGTSQGMPYFMVGDDVFVRALIEEDSGMKDDSGSFNAFAYFEGFATAGWTKAADCSHADKINTANGKKLWNCAWEVLNVQSGKVKIRFNETDITGNKDASRSTKSSAFTSFFIEYYNAATDSFITLPESEVEVYFQETNETPDYWTASIADHFPNKVDSKTAALVAHDVWFKLLLSPNVDDVSIVSVTLEKCENPSDHNSTDYSSYADPKKTTLVNPSIDSLNPWIRIGLNRGTIKQGSLRFNCTMNIVSLKKGKLSQIEKENLVLSTAVIKQDDIADSVNDEIDSVKNGWIIQATNGWVPQLAKVFDIANQLCSMMYALQSMLSALGAIHLAAAWTEGIPALKGIGAATETISKVAEKLHSGMWSKVYRVCDYISCRTSYCDPKNTKAAGGSGNPSSKLCAAYGLSLNNWGKNLAGGTDPTTGKDTPNAFGTAMTKLAKADFISGLKPECAGPSKDLNSEKCQPNLDNLISADPKSSLWGSIRTLCIPGIIMNMNKAREIECNYLYCLNKDVAMGIPIYACTSVRSYSWCMFFWGELFQILPFTAFLKSFLQQIKGIFENPQQLIFGAAAHYICNLDNWGLNAVCRLTQAYQSFQELDSIYKQMSENKDYFSFDTDMCDKALEEDKK
ncbi:MAG: hypothetical protein NT001_00780 [Candidatus Woesearchaeota archaeon]|nr:hypothetical protein [Candidatus Woesearchaeota archaeon]